jgi:hypothetical protein
MSIYGDSILHEITVSAGATELDIAEAYHEVFSITPLWWVAESSHLHDAESAGFIIPLVHTDAGEDYLLLDDNDGNPIDLKQTMSVNEAYHDLDDNDGNPITLQPTPQIAETYHLHDADNIDTETAAWTVAAQTGGSIITLGSWAQIYTFRSLINGGDITKAGNQIRLKLTGINHTFTHDIDTCSIMKRSVDYDSLGPPVQITFDIGSAGKNWDFGDIWTDWINFDIEPGQDLLVHFDMGSGFALSGAADSVYPSRYFPNGTARSKYYYTEGELALYPEWTRDNDEEYYDTNEVTGNKYNWYGGARAYNYVILVAEIQVRGTPYTAGELYIHDAAHKIKSDHVLLPFLWRTDFAEFAKGSSGAPIEYPAAIIEDVGYTANATYAITGDGAGNVSMATFKLTTTSLTTHRFPFFEAGPGAYNADDVEILTKLKTDQSSDRQMEVALRCVGDTGYLAILEVASNNVEITRQVNDSSYSVLNNAGMSLSADTWYWVRFRANGTNLYLKVWADGAAEPGPWTVTTTDATHAWGFTGLKKSAATGSVWCDYYEIATGGLSAAGTMLVDCCYHEHDAESASLSVTAWENAAMGSEGTAIAGRNYRMIVLSSDFNYGDSDGFVRLKIEAPASEGITFNGASIGQRATSGELFDYDSATVLHTRFTFDGGNSSKALGAGQTAWSDWVPFAVDKTKDHLIHLYISAAHKYPYHTSSDCYRRQGGGDQTMDADVSGYSLVGEFLCLVRLEVRARTALTGLAETYHDIDDNDGAAIDLFTINGAYHTHIAEAPLWWVNEAYHDHAADNIIWPDLVLINETYHDHAADPCDPVQVMPINEAYHLHDADNIALIIPLVHTDTGEDYLLLDDNDGNPIDLIGGFEIQETYHEIYSIAPLWWVNEVYHDHIADSPYVFSIHEAYHTHAADSPYVFSIHEAYHTHAADSPYVFSIHEAYHAHIADNISLGGVLDINEAYHDHIAEAPLWWVSEAYHDHIADIATFAIPLIHTDAGEDYLTLDDNDGNPLAIFALTLSDLEETYHEHFADSLAFTVPLYHTDAGEDYLEHFADGLGVFGLTLSDLEESYHLHFTRDPLWWVAESYHLHDAENVDLVSGFAIQETYHEHFADNVGLIVELAINGSDHEHFADTIGLGVWLSVQESSHNLDDNDGNAIDLSLVLTGLDSYHEHDAETISAWAITITIADGDSEHYADNISLTNVLEIQEAYHDIDDNDGNSVDIFQRYFLVVAGDALEHYADTIVLSQLHILKIWELYHDIHTDYFVLAPKSYLPDQVLEPKFHSLTSRRSIKSLTVKRSIKT